MPRRRLALVASLAVLLAVAAPAAAQTPPPPTAPAPTPTPTVPTVPVAPTTIAAGVATAGIALQGLTVGQAAAAIEAQLAPGLEQPLIFGAAGVPWRLTMTKAKLRLDALKTARRALAAPAGTTTVKPAITHSRPAVRAFVARIARRVFRAPRDAAIRIGVRHIARVHAKPGHALDVAAARAAVHAALADPAAPRVLHQRLVRTTPRIRDRDLARVYSTVITIDRASFTLRLFKRLRIDRRYPIAVGMAGLETPPGRYAIQNKQVNPAWHVPNSAWAGALAGHVIPGGAPDNPLKARWLGIANGVGIHGTAEDWSIGTRASHGCIRMHVSDVVDLYSRVPVGTPVLIR